MKGSGGVDTGPPPTLLSQISHPATGAPVSKEGEEPGDQVGDRPMLRSALRPARRLPWGLLFTSTLSSSDLGKWKVDSLLPDPQAKDWGPRTGPDLGGAKQASQDIETQPQNQPPPLTPSWPPCQQECQLWDTGGTDCDGSQGPWNVVTMTSRAPHVPWAPGLGFQGI